MKPLVGIIMGSKSDWEVMKPASLLLKEFDIPHEIKIVSAHRTPRRMMEYAETAHARGLKVIIAGAGGAARVKSDYCRSGRSSPFARNGSFADTASGNRSSGEKFQQFGRLGQFTEHCSDAQRRSGGNCCRQCCEKRWNSGSSDSFPAQSRSAGKNSGDERKNEKRS